jgi:hypothetical protein
MNKETTMSHESHVKREVDRECTLNRPEEYVFTDWIDRDLQRLEEKWLFLSSPKAQVRCVVVERGNRTNA